ncbi:hypothetical protein DPMN_042210 [Dreissena polymorpha]|uniref:Uncharacterized protein n=1 Tax=Dreissena polymorpha TaxID=45954 RepID=A0A9D4CZ68_DREPO|nr:hypothetical protein DPMN_042210 [Dreissena polymorpha]
MAILIRTAEVVVPSVDWQGCSQVVDTGHLFQLLAVYGDVCAGVVHNDLRPLLLTSISYASALSGSMLMSSLSPLLVPSMRSILSVHPD